MASLLTTPLAQHMGQLHPYENFLVVAIAFGPFLVLAVVVFFVRRRDLAEDDPPESDVVEGPSGAGVEGVPDTDAATPTQDQPPSADTGVSPGHPPAT